jgi:hypothetical protein
MSGIRLLPDLKPQTFSAIEECMSKGPVVMDLRMDADALFRGGRVCAPFLYLTFEIRLFSERVQRGDFLCIECAKRQKAPAGNSSPEDCCHCEDFDNPQSYLDALLKHETNLSRLAHISARAIECGDIAFASHLKHAIHFVSDPSNLRRFAVALAVSNLAGGFCPQPITLRAVKERVEELLNGPVLDRSLTDDLKALDVSYERQKRGRPKKLHKDG